MINTKVLAKQISTESIGELQLASQLKTLFPSTSHFIDGINIYGFIKAHMPDCIIRIEKLETVFIIRKERIPGVGEVENRLGMAKVKNDNVPMAILEAALWAYDDEPL